MRPFGCAKVGIPTARAPSTMAGAAVDARVRLALEAPVPFAPKVHRPLIRCHHAWDLIVAARFQQQHTDVRVLGQSARYHRTGRPRSADNKVIPRLEVGTKFPLI